jgi:hypothetical protein
LEPRSLSAAIRARAFWSARARHAGRLRMLPDKWRDRLLLNMVGVSKAMKRAGAG